MFIGLEHTAIASPNPERLANWYVEHLEFVINFQYDKFFFVKAKNGSMLEIIPASGKGEAPALADPGIRHLAIAVDDFDACYQALRSKNVVFAGEPYENSGNRLVFFRDPDGNLLHLIAREKPLP